MPVIGPTNLRITGTVAFPAAAVVVDIASTGTMEVSPCVVVDREEIKGDF